MGGFIGVQSVDLKRINQYVNSFCVRNRQRNVVLFTLSQSSKRRKRSIIHSQVNSKDISGKLGKFFEDIKYWELWSWIPFVNFTPKVISSPSKSPKTGEIAVFELQKIRYQASGDWDSYLFNNLDLAVFPNELILIVGDNGVGKSTLLSLCFGDEKPMTGVIMLDGIPSNSRKLRSKIGRVLQDPSDAFIFDTVIEELIMLRSTTPARAREVLFAVGLENISLKADPRQLSGGQARRLAIACQLVRDSNPKMLLLDEPLVGIDWIARKGMIQLLNTLKKTKSILIVTHEPGELLPYADRVLQLTRRRLIQVDQKTLHNAIEIRRKRGEYAE